MPQTEWYLKPWEQNIPNNLNYIKILIDPALVSGDRSTFGASLFLPYTLELPRGTQLVSLLSLEGWVSWGLITILITRRNCLSLLRLSGQLPRTGSRCQ
jgi:hypothetical protein